MAIKSLIINPGSTSTKIGVFEDETLLFEKTLRHSTEEISQYASIADQKDFRKEIITTCLAENDCDIKSLNMVVGRGGMLKSIPNFHPSGILRHRLHGSGQQDRCQCGCCF